MKTIEEAAKEHQYPYNSKFGIWAIEITEHISRVSFKKGAEFAQRWIPVEEDLPKINTWVDLMIDNLEYNDKYKHNQIYILDDNALKYIKDNYTHWRLVELK